jgi:1,4-alpha-glucan branching enzyme
MEKPQITDFDIHLWNQSKHYRAYQKLGAHLCRDNGQDGVHFAVWAPNAAEVHLVGDFNQWTGRAHPLTHSPETGIWSAFVPGIEQGTNYKYSIRSRYRGYKSERSDPYGFFTERRPETASRVWDIQSYDWGDESWLQKRKDVNLYKMPLNIYEIHLGSWMRTPEGEWLSYRDIAPRLAAYVQDMGYTHIELLPVTEHPFDGSWGYQVTGYFAPTSRFGTPEDFMFLVDTLHQHGVGVILDWVPAHFPKDGHALGFFDGTHLYEHADPRKGQHPEWGTFIFNYGRPEVRNFLISSALFWLDRYHIDGIRVDAVASMLYLDYGRNPGEFVPNQYGGRENLEAVDFIREFNRAITEFYPDVFTCAEESTSWPKVTGDPDKGGLGFTFKWNMGWMNDTLEVFEKEPIHRKHHHNKLTFGMMYQYSENFMLPLSHDEVVHLKKALLTKMPGDDWQRFANLRLLFGYQMGFPGKKLNFMGGEFGQWSEWNHDQSMDWHLLELEPHKGVQQWVRELNALYQADPALYELDSWPEGFRWVNCDKWEQSLLTFLRFPEGMGHALCFGVNFTPVPRGKERIGLPWGGEWTYLLSSDEPRFGGSGVALRKGHPLLAEKIECDGFAYSLEVDLPPLGVIVMRSERPEPEPETESELEADSAEAAEVQGEVAQSSEEPG